MILNFALKDPTGSEIHLLMICESLCNFVFIYSCILSLRKLQSLGKVLTPMKSPMPKFNSIMMVNGVMMDVEFSPFESTTLGMLMCSLLCHLTLSFVWNLLA